MSNNPLTGLAADWDSILLGGLRSPGQAIVTGGILPSKWDVRRGYALSGATTVFTGIDIKSFSVKLLFWDEADIEHYNILFVPMLGRPPQGKFPKSLAFYHPAVSEPPIGIRAVGVESVSQLKLEDETGLWSVEIQLIPYKPPKPAIAKPIAAGPAKPKPQDAGDIMIQDLSAQLKALKAEKN